MKKFFTKAMAVVMMAFGSMTLTSCDTSGLADLPWDELITNLLGNLLGGKTGTTYTYTVNAGTAELFSQPEPEKYYRVGEPVDLRGTTLSVTDCGNTANITIPALSVGGAQTASVTISGLSMKAVTLDNGINEIEVSLPDSYNGEGTLTIDGQQYSLSSAYIEDCYVSANDAMAGYLQFYFGPNGEYIVSLRDVECAIVKSAE